MIPLLSRARSRIADMLNARTLAQTVRILSRQLDHAHLAGQIEEARADRAEERVAELELQLADWREASGELVAEQAAADLPDLEPADDSGPPSPLPADPYARAEIQAKRADAAERHRLAAEAHAADLESELATTRAQLRQTERSAGAHLATIEALREELAEALQDAAEMKELARRTIFTQEQPLTCRSCGGPCEEDRRCYARPTCHRCLPPPPALDVLQIPGVADTPPETQPSARITATAGVQS